MHEFAPTRWELAKWEAEQFGFGNENLLIMRVEDLETIVHQARELKNEGQKAFIACMFGLADNQDGHLPPKKLTAILFPVIHTPPTEGQPNSYVHYDFPRDPETRRSYMENPKFIQQTWIDPTTADTSNQRNDIINHFFNQRNTEPLPNP
ncbi:MAG: hypothetical protein H6581_22830 [Bacteroidia bacterium]|nr:hypothetical protein [Bacteroidia bacterium]